MTESVPERLRPALSRVVERVAAGDFDGLKRDGIDPQPDADLSTWIRNYGTNGATVIPLPPEAWQLAEATPVSGRDGEWFVVVPLWTTEEGRSDLSIEARVVEVPGRVSVVIEGIHVL